MKLPLPSIQRHLLHFYMDNLVFRHEIGMNWKGKLRWGSPVLAMHLIMLQTLALAVVGWLLWGWGAVALVALGTLAVAALLAQPLAFRTGYRSISHERRVGSLAQLWLTLLSDQELFEGKYYGSLAAFLEARRYLALYVALLALSLGWLIRSPGVALAMLALGLLLFNHIVFSVQMGLLSGLRTAAQNRPPFPAIVTDRDHDIIVPQLIALLRGLIQIVLLLIAAAVACFLLGDHRWIMALPLLLAPHAVSGRLHDLEVQRREKLMQRFKRKIVFE